MKTDDDLDDDLNLGPCCACGLEGPKVRNVAFIDKRAPVAGHGWGCLVCGLSCDGASYVLCDDCCEQEKEPRFACAGYPGRDGRVPIESLTEDFRHDMARHTEE